MVVELGQFTLDTSSTTIRPPQFDHRSTTTLVRPPDSSTTSGFDHQFDHQGSVGIHLRTHMFLVVQLTEILIFVFVC